jgi:hypothetical protein
MKLLAPIPLHETCKLATAPGLMCENCGINHRIEQWIEKNNAPVDIVNWLRRPENVSPYVTLKNKKDYINSHQFVKQLREELSKPHEITKVSSIQEAMEITMKDIKKGSN